MWGARKIVGTLLVIAGALLVPILWWFLTNVVGVSQRFLPPLSTVATAWVGLQPPITVHIGATAVRFVVGFVLGTVAGISLSLLMVRSQLAASLLSPTIYSMRAVPGAAMVPFFLLWFGFSEIGRLLLATVAVAFNVAVAASEVLASRPLAHDVFFLSVGLNPSSLTLRYCLPRIVEAILPTLRYSLAFALGAVALSELLGSQVGLGYLIQTSRATFSHGLLMLAMILFGSLAALADFGLRRLWNGLVYWRKRT